MPRISLIERAYQLASSGDYFTATGIKIVLKREGYSGVESTMVGAGFRRELKALMLAARTPSAVAA